MHHHQHDARSDDPSACATASATLGVSPVIMTTSMPL
jgi:hypothetical protein